MKPDTEKKWMHYAQRTLQREMGHALIKSIDLAQQLGIKPNTLAKRIRQGAFTAGFFLQALEALGIEEINLKEIEKREGNTGE
jgi:hypothetical protein